MFELLIIKQTKRKLVYVTTLLVILWCVQALPSFIRHFIKSNSFHITVQQHSKRQGTCLRLEQTLSNPDYQLDRLRSTHTTSTMMTEYNPNYDFGDAKYTIQDLREIPRESLSFVKWVIWSSCYPVSLNYSVYEGWNMMNFIWKESTWVCLFSCYSGYMFIGGHLSCVALLGLVRSSN